MINHLVDVNTYQSDHKIYMHVLYTYLHTYCTTTEDKTKFCTDHDAPSIGMAVCYYRPKTSFFSGAFLANVDRYGRNMTGIC